MKRAKNRKKTVVTLLKEAQPAFVSIVRRGAIQRGFHAIKSEGGQTATKESEMGKQRKIKSAEDIAVQRITFAKAEYPDVASVEAFLTEKGYSEFDVQEEGETFYVEDTPADQIEGDTRAVESNAAKGVTYLVGNVKKSDEAETDPAEAGDEGNAGEGGDEEKAAKDDGDHPPAAGEGEGGKEGDKPADAPAEGSAPGAGQEAPAEGADEAAKKSAPKPRQRIRKAAFVVKGLTPTALAATYESLADFIEENGITAKTFADSVAEYTGGVAPGLWALNDAFMTELRKALKAGRADDAYVGGLATEFASSVIKMTAAYQSIINEETTVAKSANAEPELEAVLDHLFGPALQAPEENDALSALKSAVGTLEAEVRALTGGQANVLGFLQTVLDRSAVEEYEDAMKGEDRGDVRVIQSRKSQDAEEQVVPQTDAEAEAEEEAEQKRVAKRLGLVV